MFVLLFIVLFCLITTPFRTVGDVDDDEEDEDNDDDDDESRYVNQISSALIYCTFLSNYSHPLLFSCCFRPLEALKDNLEFTSGQTHQ